MKMKFGVLLLFVATGCGRYSGNADINSKAEILRLLDIQEIAYNDQTEENLKKFRETCSDSLISIGGDDGGMFTTADPYLTDLGDGYTRKPYDRTFRFYSNTVVVTSLHQGYKILAGDTLYLNSRSTKVFTKENNQWKMVYVTYAPLAILYNKRVDVDPSKFMRYTGVYDLGENVLDSVFVEDGKLYSDVAHSGKAELIPVNDSTFIGNGYFGKAIFSGKPPQTSTHYTFEWVDGQRIKFKRVK